MYLVSGKDLGFLAGLEDLIERKTYIEIITKGSKIGSKKRCVLSKVQEYQCQVCMKPNWETEKSLIGVDLCLAQEIRYLWDCGIVTTGSCCGKHVNMCKEACSYISTDEAGIEKIERLGYEPIKGHKFHYKPKTVI